MIFNEPAFLFLFLPTVMALFFAPGLARLRVFTLIISSLVFYGLAGIEHAIVLCADVLWVYFIVTRPGFRGNKALLIAATIPPLFALAYYKYLGFIIGSLFDLTDPGNHQQFSLFLDVLLPAGISFFTFQVISFAIDRYRDDIETMPSLPNFAAFVTLFPQLVAGPILRFSQVEDALAKLREFKLSKRRLSMAWGYICLGLAAKVLIADTLGGYLVDYRESPGNLSQLAGLYTNFAYSFQIYFDFYGYSLIAIGLGALFGFDYPDNFKRPYEALNPREFWRRWHITLSFWIRDYLYIPMGGNRAYIRNIIIVMAVCGLWHGAGWTFIVWGLYHAALVAAYHYGHPYWDALPKLFQRAMTFTLVSLGWTLFLFNFTEIKMFISSLMGGTQVLYPNPSPEMWLALAIAATVSFGVRFEAIAQGISADPWRAATKNISLLLLFVLVVLFLDRSETFIYFRF